MRKVLTLVALFILFPACSRGTVEIDNSQVLETQEIPTLVKQGKEWIDPVHGRQTSFSYGAVNGINEVNANGIAFVHGFADGSNAAIVNVNIQPAEKGTVYVAWLKSGNGSIVKIGELTNPLGDVRHTVKLETKEKVSEHLIVTVTQEASVSVASPQGKSVSEGTLRKVK